MEALQLGIDGSKDERGKYGILTGAMMKG